LSEITRTGRRGLYSARVSVQKENDSLVEWKVSEHGELFLLACLKDTADYSHGQIRLFVKAEQVL